jgi:hypothetical protein
MRPPRFSPSRPVPARVAPSSHLAAAWSLRLGWLLTKYAPVSMVLFSSAQTAPRFPSHVLIRPGEHRRFLIMLLSFVEIMFSFMLFSQHERMLLLFF